MSLFKKKSNANKPEKKNLRSSFAAVSKKHSSRKGAFSAAITALVIVAVVVFNLIVAQLPDTATQFDLTDSKIYNITQTSQKYLKSMKHDVVIHVLADKNSMDTRITRFIKKYASLSDHVSVEYVNPTVYPSVLTKYDCESNTIVVTCKDTDRQETVSISDIIGYDESSYYTTGSATESTFDAEGLLTSAVDGILTNATYKAYQTTGHDETAIPTAIETQFKKSHMSVDSVNLLTDNGVPDDCDLLILNAPTKDLSDDELTSLQEYLSDGGQVIYCMAGQDLSLPNFEKLCSTYGMKVADGIVADTERYYQNNPYLFFPTVDTTVDAAENVSSDATILYYASRGFTITDPARSSITTSGFLTTSAKSYTVTSDEKQTQGTYTVGAVATEKIDDDTTARFTVYGSDSLINEQILQSFPSVDNSSLFLSAATCGFSDLASLNIDPVSLSTPTNTITTGGIWAVLFIFIIPAVTLILGFVRWMRRRKL